MTKQEAIDNLVAGASNAGGKYITVTREHLLLALGAQPEQKPDGNPSVISPDAQSAK